MDSNLVPVGQTLQAGPPLLRLDSLDQPQGAGLAIGFAEFGHNCIITTISNCSCSMNFYNGFQPQPLMTFKQALFGKFTGFYLVDIQPWPGPATWAG